MDNKTDRELLEEIKAKLDKIEQYQKEERIRRYIRLGVIALIIIILAIIIVPKAVDIYNSYTELMAKVHEYEEVLDSINTDNVKSLIDGLDGIDFSKIKDIAEKLDGVDLSQLEETMTKIKSIDFDALNDVMETLQLFTGKVSSMFG